jgi:hypothetical protein
MICYSLRFLQFLDDIMKDIEKKASKYEQRYNAPYTKLLNTQLSVVKTAIVERGKPRIKSALWTTLDILSPYISTTATAYEFPDRY